MTKQISIPTKTEAANTAIVVAIPGITGQIPLIDKLMYSCGTTAHTVTIMKTVASAQIAATANSGQATIELDRADPLSGEDLAANDFVAWWDNNGVLQVDSVASISSNTITLNSNLPTDTASGNWLYAFYEVGRADHQQFTMPISSVTTLEGLVGGRHKQGGAAANDTGAAEPILLHSNNVTAAGSILYASGNYVASTEYLVT